MNQRIGIQFKLPVRFGWPKYVTWKESVPGPGYRKQLVVLHACIFPGCFLIIYETQTFWGLGFRIGGSIDNNCKAAAKNNPQSPTPNPTAKKLD